MVEFASGKNPIVTGRKKKITLLDIGLALLLLLLFIDLVLISVHKKRWRNWPIPSHIDGTRLVNNAYVWTEKIKWSKTYNPVSCRPRRVQCDVTRQTSSVDSYSSNWDEYEPA